MRRLLVVAFALTALLAFAAPAGAAPPGGGLGSFTVDCSGTETQVTVSAGSSFWIGDQQYLLTSESGTFTPDGGDPEPLGTNTFGNKAGLAGTEITCSSEFLEEGGVFEIVITAVAVPPRR